MSHNDEKYEVVIVGGGISGLHTALELAKQGISFLLLEARERLGGRIYSPSGSQSKANFDIGPSWFWPGQAHIEGLVMELGLQDKVFEQYHQGDSIYEPIGSDIMVGVNGISMQGSYRVQGGLGTIIDALTTQIVELSNADSLMTNAKAQSIKLSDKLVNISLDSGVQILTEKVVLALPPRVAMQKIEFSPSLPEERKNELNKVATWMAGHAKMVAIYAKPFWREAGLSGDVISQKGPLSEVHDATPIDSDVSSLFGFFSTPPQYREKDKIEVDKKIIEQLVRIFGEQAATPVEIIYKDWAKDTLTATAHDQLISNHHPSNYWSTKIEPVFNNRIIWSGTESANGHYNGYIEGAIIASKNTLSML